MPSSHQLLAFVAASVLFIQVPGPSLLFAVGRALTVTRRDALLSVTGNGLGVFAQAAAVAVGLGALVSASATAFTVLKVVGAAYVAYLGIQTIRHRTDARRALDAADSTAGATVEHAPRLRRASLRAGVVVGATNPKTLVFFAAFLPQFVDVDHAAAPQLLLLGAAFSVLAVASDSCWVLAAGRARDWFAREPRRLDRLGVAGGVMMLGLSAVLLTATEA